MRSTVVRWWLSCIWTSSNRFIYVEPLPDNKHLPRINYCAVIRCLLFHFGQPKLQRTLTCTNCWTSGHTRNHCNNEPRCRVCKTPGHEPRDPTCSEYEQLQNVIAFNGEDSVLSNFFPCGLNLYGMDHKSAEHAFQYAKAMRCGSNSMSKYKYSAKN